MNNSLHDYGEYRSRLLNDVILPIEISVGILVNISAIFIWVFGPKSRSLCCATYFAANAVADFLTLSIVGLYAIICVTHFNKNCYYSDVSCKISKYLNGVLFMITNWISTVITVERSMTILFPLKFRSQDMPRNSKYTIRIIIVLALLGNIDEIFRVGQHEGTIFCSMLKDYEIYNIIKQSVRIFLPFIVIVIFNCCTIATLCKQRRNSVSANQGNYVHVFTKLTIVTGLSFVASNTTGVIFAIWLFWRKTIPETDLNEYLLVLDLGQTMFYLNCLMNPIICVVICKSMIDDIRTFGQRLRLVFRCGQHGITT